MVEAFENKVAFAIGTGRCGTTFLAKVIGLEQTIVSSHMRSYFGEAFHHYCKWYGLPVDPDGLLYAKESEIEYDLRDHQFSFEASPFLSLYIEELYQRFQARFVLLVRRPDSVVNSHLAKGWYQEEYVRSSPELAPGIQANVDKDRWIRGQYVPSFRTFTRIVPRDETFLQWRSMTRVGKLAWYWGAINNEILRQFSRIPETHWRVVRIEDLSWERYSDLLDFLFGVQPSLVPVSYDKIVNQRPNSGRDVPTVVSWSEIEIAEFEKQVEPMARHLGYEYRIDALTVPQKLNYSRERVLYSKAIKRFLQKL